MLTSYTPPKEDIYTPLVQKLEIKDCKIQEYQDTIDSLNMKLDTLTATTLDRFILKPSVNTDISPQLWFAISEYKGPTHLVTSMRRYKHPRFKNMDRGAHGRGDAWDIRLDKRGLEVLSWLVSKEGTQWRKRHRVSFKVEDSNWTSLMDSLHEKYSKYMYIHDGATGAHIHLQINV